MVTDKVINIFMARTVALTKPTIAAGTLCVFLFNFCNISKGRLHWCAHEKYVALNIGKSQYNLFRNFLC